MTDSSDIQYLLSHQFFNNDICHIIRQALKKSVKDVLPFVKSWINVYYR